MFLAIFKGTEGPGVLIPKHQQRNTSNDLVQHSESPAVHCPVIHTRMGRLGGSQSLSHPAPWNTRFAGSGLVFRFQVFCCMGGLLSQRSFGWFC